MHDEHRYAARLTWVGNLGGGTATYQGYGRGWRLSIDGRPDILGSADPAFRGDPSRHNPEDLLVAALSSCHMLSYLALCARNGVVVVRYDDVAEGVMRTTPDGGGRFESVTLHPRVVVTDEDMVASARELLEKAHEQCFIASSVSFPVRHEALVTAGV